MKHCIREIAGELIKVAAERLLREAPRLTVETAMYDEFAPASPMRRPMTRRRRSPPCLAT